MRLYGWNGNRWAGRLALVALLLSAGVAPAGAAEGRMESDAAVARAGDDTYLVFRAGGGELPAHLGRPDPDSLDVSLDEGIRLVAKEGAVLQAGAAAELSYGLSPGEYRFSFARKSSDAGARGRLRVTDRKPEDVFEVTLDGKAHPWEKDEGILVRDVPLESVVVVRFR